MLIFQYISNILLVESNYYYGLDHMEFSMKMIQNAAVLAVLAAVDNLMYIQVVNKDGYSTL
jgi:hypothetical protein